MPEEIKDHFYPYGKTFAQTLSEQDKRGEAERIKARLAVDGPLFALTK